MSMPSPPKPWERAGVTTSSTTPLSSSTTATTTSDTPTVPQRPTSISQTSPSSTIAPRTLPYNSMSTSYSSPYSTFGTSSYMSPYNRFGSAGSYGGYGGYGGYGSYGGYGGYGGGGYPMGMNVDPNTGQPSLMQQVESSTSQTFALIQSIVGTFTGFSQMLESTFMATHSSFFAMLGVAEQFGQLRLALGQVFGLFGFVGWLRGWWKGDQRNFRRDFKKFIRGEDLQPGSPAPSKKPLVIFLLAVFGLPYIMHRIIRHISSKLPPPPGTQPIIDPSNLMFVRATHPFHTSDPLELSLSKGELVAVLTTADPVTGTEGDWWRGRTREGREGWFPKNFVEIVKKKANPNPEPISIPSNDSVPPKKIE